MAIGAGFAASLSRMGSSAAGATAVPLLTVPGRFPALTIRYAPSGPRIRLLPFQMTGLTCPVETLPRMFFFSRPLFIAEGQCDGADRSRLPLRGGEASSHRRARRSPLNPMDSASANSMSHPSEPPPPELPLLLEEVVQVTATLLTAVLLTVPLALETVQL